MADDLIGLYRTMLAEGQASPVIQAQLAQALLDDRQYDAAIEAADIALADDPNLIAARLARASACKNLCRFNEAARDYEAVNSLVPGRWGILVNLGTTYAEMDRLGEAEACLRRAVLSEPGRKEGYANLASVYTRQEKFALAEEACRKALSLDPQLIIAHQNLAGILATTNPEKARFHRDAAFRQRQIFIEPGAPSSRPVLVLTTADASGVPLTHLLPREHYTQIRWFIDYA
ncbi:MAG TPA: tetratricopeptide repeat protein, partial [Acetobacteraceae bacterium]|nr:tetratricopeptide repeat protein [Acetobacteraceae bacterium]